MSFKELKNKRDARLNQADPITPVLTDEKATNPEERALYSQLNGSNLEIKTMAGRGRGLWATSDFKPGMRCL